MHTLKYWKIKFNDKDINICKLFATLRPDKATKKED